MTEPKKMAALLKTSATTEPSLNSKRLELKWRRILRELIHGTLNRFEAERHGCHCLNSTISELRGDKLVLIESVWEEVPAMGGRTMARVLRYWVSRSESAMAHARSLLGDAGTTPIMPT